MYPEEVLDHLERKIGQLESELVELCTKLQYASDLDDVKMAAARTLDSLMAP